LKTASRRYPKAAPHSFWRRAARSGRNRPPREQPDGGLIQFAMILFQTDDQIPAHLGSQFENRGLRVKSVQQKDVEKAAAVPVRQIAQQAQSGGILALARLEPFQREKGLDGTADNLTSHCAVIIPDLFDFDSGFADCDAAFQTGVAVAAVVTTGAASRSTYPG